MARARKRSAKKSEPKRGRKTAFEWPRAFRLVPVEIKGRLQPHEHVVGQAGLPPCPQDCSYMTKISTPVGDYCVYACIEGSVFLIRC